MLPIHCFVTGLAMVGMSWFPSVGISFTEDQLVVPKAEWILVNGTWVKVNIRDVTLSQTSSTTAKIPDGQFLKKVFRCYCYSLGQELIN